MTTLRETQIPTFRVEFGAPLNKGAGDRPVSFDAIRIVSATAPNEHPAIRTGPNVDRTGRSGLFAFVLDDLSGGFRPLSTIGSYGFDKNLTWHNEGVLVHIPGQATLPFLLQPQTLSTGEFAADWSGYNAANRRVHSALWASATGQRFIAGIGPSIAKDTSVTNPALVAPSTADNVADDILTMWSGPFGGNAQALFIGTDGQTDGIKYTTDPLANSITWTSAVTFANANDRCWGGAFMGELGEGWHVFMGKVDNRPGWYAFQPSDTAPLTINTLTPVVWEATKDEIGDLPSVTLTDLDPSQAGNEGTGNLLDNSRNIWTSVTGIFSGGGASAAYQINDSVGPAVGLTSWLIAGGFNTSSVPRSARLLGLRLRITHRQLAAHSAVLAEVQLRSRNQQAGSPRSAGLTLPAASFAHLNVGGVTDDWGTGGQFTGLDIHAMNMAIRYSFNDSSGGGAGQGIEVDHVRILNLVYQFTGTQVIPRQGGFTIGPMPSAPTRLPTIEPVFDQEDSITARRILKLNDFSFDTDGGRPVMAQIVTPPTGMGYVGIMAHFQGGVVVFGGSNSTEWNECKLVDSEGVVRNLNMPKTHGGVGITAVRAVSQGNSLIVDVTDLDGADAQRWIFFDGAWNALGPLQSLSSVPTAARPIYWAETTNSLEQNRAYLFTPNSTTNLIATRQFVSPGLFDDPIVTHPDELRHPGPLSVTLPILDMGTIETQKVLLTMQAQTFFLDDETLYGSARVEINTTGDLDFGTTAVDATFGTGMGETPPFTDFTALEAANKPGAPVPTAAIRLTLDSDGTLGAPNAKTPQALPIVFWLTGQWEFDSELEFFAPANQRDGTNLSDIAHRLELMAEAKPSHRLAWEGADGSITPVPAAFLYKRVQQVRRITVLDSRGQPVTIDYDGVAFVFRTLPGVLT